MITSNWEVSSKTGRRLFLYSGLGGLAATILLVCAATSVVAAPRTPFLPAQGSTSPANGDLNPYGLAVVPKGFPSGGLIHPGQLLVSNFNNAPIPGGGGNLQGQGRTIVIMDPDTAQQTGLFFKASENVGFTNALAVLRAGFVLGGSVFTMGSSTMASSLGLLVLDRNGKQVPPIPLNGPWGLAVNEKGSGAQLFVSNVLDGTVVRVEVSLKGGNFSVVGTPTTIAKYDFNTDSAGLVVGPAGLVYDAKKDTLYVASEDDNAIYAVAHAGALSGSVGKGMLVYMDDTHLHGPLGLMLAPNGNFVTANADPNAHFDPNQPSELVEFTPNGHFVRQFSIDPNNGAAFAILNVSRGHTNQFAYVDDFSSTLSILDLSRF